MSTGVARAGGKIRAFFDMNSAAVAALHREVQRAIDGAGDDGSSGGGLSTSKDVETAMEKFRVNRKLDERLVAERGPWLRQVLSDLAEKVKEGYRALVGGIDAVELLALAGRDNDREDCGLAPIGSADHSPGLWYQARRSARLVKAELLSESEALASLSDESAQRQALALALERYSAARRAAEDFLCRMAAEGARAQARAEEAKVTSAADVADVIRRARTAGRDPAAEARIMADEVLRHIVGQLPELVKAWGEAAGPGRPAGAGGDGTMADEAIGGVRGGGKK